MKVLTNSATALELKPLKSWTSILKFYILRSSHMTSSMAHLVLLDASLDTDIVNLPLLTHVHVNVNTHYCFEINLFHREVCRARTGWCSLESPVMILLPGAVKEKRSGIVSQML